MKDVKSLFSAVESLHQAQVHKKFNSKKNTVCLISIKEKPFVLKWYKNRPKKYLNNEYVMLSQPQTLFLKPSVIEKNDEHNFLLLDYINGSNVCDLINDEQKMAQQKTQIIGHLAKWFAQFHQAYHKNTNTLIHGDANLRNFLFLKKVYGLDFEEVKKGNPTEDIADMSASILSTSPTFTKEKNILSNIFLQTYQSLVFYELEDVEKKIKLAIKKTKERRKKRF
ncbi:MAG: phosphotransferase [Thermoplasmatota archaeon]